MDVQVAANQRNNNAMKLGKGALSAIIETALFAIGAIFFLLVIIIPSNPIWALVAGIICGLAGAILWSCSLFARMGHGLHKRIKATKVNPADVAKQILEDDELETNGYELHRADSYDNLAEAAISDDSDQSNK